MPGHAGSFVFGRLGDVELLVQAGRYHLYEGHSPDVVAAPVRVAAELGVGMFVLTNAAGGIRSSLRPGDIVLLEDHINLMGRNPLEGVVRSGEARFPDMGAPYDAELRLLAVRGLPPGRIALTTAPRLAVAIGIGSVLGWLIAWAVISSLRPSSNMEASALLRSVTWVLAAAAAALVLVAGVVGFVADGFADARRRRVQG